MTWQQRGHAEADGTLPQCLPGSAANKEGLVDKSHSPPSSAHAPQSANSRDVQSNLEEVKAVITSVYGRVLKCDSTEKVVKKRRGQPPTPRRGPPMCGTSTDRSS